MQNNLHAVLQNYVHSEDKIPDYVGKSTIVQTTEIDGMKIPTYVNEFYHHICKDGGRDTADILLAQLFENYPLNMVQLNKSIV